MRYRALSITSQVLFRFFFVFLNSVGLMMLQQLFSHYVLGVDGAPLAVYPWSILLIRCMLDWHGPDWGPSSGDCVVADVHATMHWRWHDLHLACCGNFDCTWVGGGMGGQASNSKIEP